MSPTNNISQKLKGVITVVENQRGLRANNILRLAWFCSKSGHIHNTEGKMNGKKK